MEFNANKEQGMRRIATYCGRSRKHATARVARLNCGDVVHIIEVRKSTTIIAITDRTFGYRFTVKNGELA